MWRSNDSTELSVKKATWAAMGARGRLARRHDDRVSCHCSVSHRNDAQGKRGPRTVAAVDALDVNARDATVHDVDFADAARLEVGDFEVLPRNLARGAARRRVQERRHKAVQEKERQQAPPAGEIVT